MKIAIMQPYFFPYIGYFQLISAVDLFVIYDNIKYTKKGWINRNRILQNGKDIMFSLPLKSDSDYLDIHDRELSADFNREKLLNQIKGAYRHAPYFASTFPLIEQVINHDEQNLFQFLQYSLLKTCAHLGLATDIKTSSSISINDQLKNQDKVIALCKAVGAKTYINAIGGLALYAPEAFAAQGIELKFIRSKSLEYPQFNHPFVPWLSIIDVMMFNPLSTLHDYIKSNYELL